MDVSIYEQIQRLKKLLDILNGYMDNLQYHIIKAPDEAINNGLHYGLPEEIGFHYRFHYYEHNKIDTENIINYIKGVCIPALEHRITLLEEVLAV